MKTFEQYNKDSGVLELYNRYLKEFYYSFIVIIEGLYIYHPTNSYHYYLKSINMDDDYSYFSSLKIEDIKEHCEYISSGLDDGGNFGGRKKEIKAINDFMIALINNKEFIEEYNTIIDSEEIGLL